ncbi:hypothetical protein BDZ91DRAFT_750227 [Kalaharituber pfeilii]|nr:hypothetical protein BDZ91DRAFT_750227 [Kalaharituber pfeilii]
MSDSNSPTHICVVCGQPSKHFCSRCKTTRYCGKECQKRDWKDHKRHCVSKSAGEAKPAKLFAFGTRPAPFNLLPSDLYEPFPQPPPAESTIGVVIHCLGDQASFRMPKFVETRVGDLLGIEPLNLRSGHVAPITALIEVPIRVYQLPVSDAKMSDTSWDPSNQPATFLHLNPKDGWAPLYWQNEVGNVILVRKDGKRLLQEHAEAICDYCQFYIGPLFEEWMEDYPSVPVGKRRVDSAMTKEGFLKWLERDRMQGGWGIRLEKWTSPYGVTE